MQQMFVSSLIKKVMSAGTLSNPVTLYRLADAATRSLTTDPGLGSVQALLGLAESLRSLKLSHITFVTLPSKTDPANVDRLIADEPSASAVWRLLREDLPWNDSLSGAKPAAGSASARTPTAEPATQPAASSQAASPEPHSSAPASAPASSVQTRNASENLCSNLPTPNNLGELGG
jgi:anionic cell wall polymer biosynthesis LytR-Cps2A-Psr (LCP) family protein